VKLALGGPGYDSPLFHIIFASPASLRFRCPKPLYSSTSVPSAVPSI
jgi:hypothetical protein